MNQQQWLTSDEPMAMIRWLSRVNLTSDRKLRLFGCALCRLAWSLINDHRSWYAIEVAERYADNRATLEELCYAEKEAIKACKIDPATHPISYEWGNVTTAASWTVSVPVSKHKAFAALNVISNIDLFIDHARICDLIRETFGNPHKPSSLLNRVAKTRDSQLIASEAYDNCKPRSNGCTLEPLSLLVLADSLVDAGCEETDQLVTDLRSPGSHFRGFNALDVVLGKK